MRIALVQVGSPSSEDPIARRDRVGQMVSEAVSADLVMLPELWLPGYFSFERYQELAEPLGGETVEAGREWAKNLRSYLHLGSIVERGHDGRLYNTAILIDPTGKVVHVHRKVHIFGYGSREVELLSPGSQVTVASTSFGTTAATTCYDLRFPELWRSLVDLGAISVMVPAAWPAVRLDHWRLFTSCRAVEEQLMILGCNAVGDQDGTLLGGHSRVVDPWGTVLVEAGDQEGVTYCDLDMDVVDKVRQEFPVLLDRRLIGPVSFSDEAL
ncbi:MAG: carbon-nitrogen family hydrolase [Actinobacteria bacterium]|nr:carbon-nitrogen family hydrolase [Actinomycetota bacterium]